MTNLTRLLILALTLTVSFIGALIYYNSVLKDELNSTAFEVDTLGYKIDSIKSEIFILSTEVDRYRIALEMLEDENPTAASEFNKRLSMIE
jgi:hypothetical protein